MAQKDGRVGDLREKWCRLKNPFHVDFDVKCVFHSSLYLDTYLRATCPIHRSIVRTQLHYTAQYYAGIAARGREQAACHHGQRQEIFFLSWFLVVFLVVFLVALLVVFHVVLLFFKILSEI